MTSDVHVFVRFKEQCVFAGESFCCTITFKNVAELQEPSTPGIVPLRNTRRGSISQLAAANARNTQHGRIPSMRLSRKSSVEQQSHHTPALSSYNSSISAFESNLTPTTEDVRSINRSGTNHQRSISIKSVNSLGQSSSPTDAGPGRREIGLQGHRRSSTIQLTGNLHNRPTPIGRQSSFDVQPPPRRKSPLSSSFDPATDNRQSGFGVRNAAEEKNGSSQQDQLRPSMLVGSVKRSHQRAISTASRATSQRTSFEIYSGSNHSEDTIMSEQVSMVAERPRHISGANAMMRQHYKMDPPPPRRPQAATLLMGYAQVGATFTLDASLVDQTPFEEVKRKGFLGGQAGGGVVGVKKKARPTSGLFGAFNFGSIGESLESIMGGDNMSSVKEMKAVTNSRAIPILSTPQSLLFVDLHLEPGEERSYRFSYPLPRGLPASHRGKAIKIVYNLTIGIQGMPGNREVQAMRQINVPIRVFPAVDSDGEILGHDLMQPRVILESTATAIEIRSFEDEQNSELGSSKSSKNSAIDFLEYVDTLLDRNRRRQSSSGAMEPMIRNGGSNPNGRQAILAIDRAIMFGNQTSNSNDSSPNRFEITRNGQRIAVVTLDRPLHRLGETVTAVVDLSKNDVQCTSLRATLETAEKVTPSLAVRSASSINRVTRRAHASRSENVLFAERVVFCPSIPASATPSFITTGVNLEWYIKLEFCTVHADKRDEVATEEDSVDDTPSSLLEDILTDERGTVKVAVESLDCDMFEVAIPITVYGDVVHGEKENEEVLGIPI